MNSFFINNRKNLIIFLIIFLIILVFAVGAFFIFKSNYFGINKKEIIYKNFSSNDNNLSIKINSDFSFESVDGEDNYNLVLRSDSFDSNLYISSFNSTRVRNLETVLNSDSQIFLDNFKNKENVSSLKKINNDKLNVYEFHFDSNSRYIQIYYVVFKDIVYVFDFDIDSSKTYDINLKDHTEEIVKSTTIKV